MSEPIVLFYKIRGARAQRRVVSAETFQSTYTNLKGLGATILIDVSVTPIKEQAA
jgi:hypothetical protein